MRPIAHTRAHPSARETSRDERRAWVGMLAIALVLAVAVATGLAGAVAEAVGHPPVQGSGHGR